MIAKKDSTSYYLGADIYIGLSSLSMRADNHKLELDILTFFDEYSRIVSSQSHRK